MSPQNNSDIETNKRVLSKEENITLTYEAVGVGSKHGLKTILKKPKDKTLPIAIADKSVVKTLGLCRGL